MEENEKYLRAKKRVERLKAFYIHATVYVLVNVFLFIINLVTSDTWWFYYPLLGWSIGLFIHGITTFGMARFGEDWEKRKIEQYMNKDL